MPLDMTDIEKIQAMVEKSIPRLEYENRHIELVQRVTKLEDGIKEVSRYILSEFEKSRTEREANFQRSLDAIHEVAKQCDEIKASQAKTQGATLRYIISVIVSFFLGGGGIVGLLEMFKLLGGK